MPIKSSNQITFTEHKKIVEIKEWYLATNENTGITIETDGWTTDIQTIDYDHKYLWNYEEVIYTIGSSDISDPVIIGFYGEGKGIIDIKNVYFLTETPELPDSPEWSDDVSVITGLSPTNKYLWNKEIITYTVGDPTETSPAIIGVYGDSGSDAITFEIYSTQGFIFKENMEEIELKIAAFKGSTPITDATYTWEWWDDTLNDGEGGYVPILNYGGTDNESVTNDVSNTSLIVYKSAEYAFSHLRCTMTYDGNTYEDYVDLTNETIIYSSVIKFFDGSNIFNSSVPYLIAYVNLYRNNVLVDSILTNRYYDGENTISNGAINTDITGEFSDGDLMYFIYEKEVMYQEISEDGTINEIKKNIPCAVLGQYQSNAWSVYENESQYVYVNDVYSDITSNVIVISKEDVSKSRDINFVIYKNEQDENGNYIYNNETYVVTTNAIVIDINDPIISSVPPENVNYGQLWLDTSSTPYMLYVYTQIGESDNGEWKYFSQQSGGAVYTSQPSQYSAGDLWILGDGEVCPYEYEWANVTSETEGVYYKCGFVGDKLVYTEVKLPDDYIEGLAYFKIESFFQPGTMLRSTKERNSFWFEDWVDAMEENTEILNNVKQYFEFNADNGLRIGQKDEKFYVNISSTEMGFYDNSNFDNPNQKVVSIGNSSATIKNAVINDSATFNCNAKFNNEIQFGNFVWKIEKGYNGEYTLSLAIAD